MSHKKLSRYKGKLTPAEAAAGINCARHNAKRLATDAQRLLTADQYPSALALAILSIEESGKVSVLRSLVLARSDDEVKTAWREYRSHTAKNRLWPIVELVQKGARKLDDFASLFSDQSEHTLLLDQLKQIAFYTDCLGNCHWSEPGQVIDKNIATMIVHTSELLSQGDDVSIRELELWVKHLGPVWKKAKEVMEKGLVDWQAAMQAEGLKRDGGEEMQKFILEGIQAE